MNSAPLKGIKVLDLTIVLAGPTCGRTLAQYGAEVIKIDPENRKPQLYQWIDVSRGKKSVSLNLKSPGGKETFLKLAEKADVILEGFRKGTTDKLGIGYDQIRKINPKLIYASINCYGHKGPWQFRPGFEQNAQAVTGIQMRNGSNESGPRAATYTLYDYGTGLAAAYGVMLALLERNKTNKGKHIGASLAGTSTFLTGPYATSFKDKSLKNDIGGPGLRGRGPLCSLYECQNNEWIFFKITNETQWVSLVSTDQFKVLAKNPLFSSFALREDNKSELFIILREIIKKKSALEWVEFFKGLNIPSIKNTLAQEIHSSEYNTSRKMIVSKDYSNDKNDLYREWGKTTWAGNPVKMTGYNISEINPSMFSEHTVEVLKKIGLSNSDIKEMKKNGTIPKEEMLPFSPDSSEPL